MPQYNLEELNESLSRTEEATQKRLQQYYNELAAQPAMEEVLEGKIKNETEEMKKTAEHLQDVRIKMLAGADELETRFKEIQASQKKRRIIPAAPANAVIDYKEKQARHFAQGLNIYKILLVAILASIIGVIVETLFCLVVIGEWQSRVGLVYGPFNLLYGVGAVCLTLALYKYRNRSWLISFFGGMIVGSVVEYLCSWGQEMLIGSRSRDYSSMPFNINGRICLLYSIFWGVLGVLWIKNIYPRMAQVILKIPNHIGKIATWCVVGFLILDSLVSVIAVGRWAARVHGQEASNSFQEWVDERFTDERMEKIFPSMSFETVGQAEES